MKLPDNLPKGVVTSNEQGIWIMAYDDDPGNGTELNSTNLFEAAFEALEAAGVLIIKKMKGQAH